MPTSILVFVIATAAVLFIGPRLARIAEALAERTGVGNVLVGAVLLGVVTSLPGLVLTVTAAARGDVELAVANAIGGVAAQTAFVAIADIAYRRGTLSSGVPTREVSLQAALLVVLLALVAIGLGTPDVRLGPIHPMTVAMIVLYGFGLSAGRNLGRRTRAGTEPSLEPSIEASEQRRAEGGRGGLRGKIGDIGEASRREHARSTADLTVRFVAFAGLMTAAGFALSITADAIIGLTGLSPTSVGFAFTSVATSTPELVTAVAAARRGAIGLSAGDIIGGNVFDTLFIAAADVASGGKVFSGAGPASIPITGLALLMNGILLAGLMRAGPGARRVDLESYAVVAVWLIAVVLIVA